MSEKQTENTAVAEVKPDKHVTNFALGVFGSSDNFLMAGQMAKALSQSTIVPKEYQGNTPNCMVAMEIATRNNISPLLVMQNLNVIQGRPAWSAQFLISMINGSGKYDMELQYDEKTDKNGKPFSCSCWTTRGGRRVMGPIIDMDMANAEGWTTKNGSKWKTMPQIMLRYRAASFFSRLCCPELSLGYYTKEEIIDTDFHEYPLEEMEKQVNEEIAESQNTVVLDGPEEPTATAEVETQDNEPTIPSFMSAE